jgi:hypothetical protein
LTNIWKDSIGSVLLGGFYWVTFNKLIHIRNTFIHQIDM